jgi:stress response protein SCP2
LQKKRVRTRRSDEVIVVYDAPSGHTVSAASTIRLNLSWDAGAKPVDVDLQCCVFDSVGLMLDACYFNNHDAMNGALHLSGDSRDGAASGADEAVTINLANLPPYAAGIVAGVFCTAGGELSASHHATVTAEDLNSGDQLSRSTINAEQSATGAIVFVLQRTSANEWQVAVRQRVFAAHKDKESHAVRSFVDAVEHMQALLNVPAELQREFRSQQPVYDLKKHEKKKLPLGLSDVAFGLGWDAGCDVDASVIALKADGISHELIYFGNKTGCNGAIIHSGDNTTGDGDGDDETIELRLMDLDDDVTHCFVCVNVYSAGQNFTNVKNEAVRIYDLNSGQALMRYGSLDGHGKNNGVVLGCLYRDRTLPQRWVFNATSLGAQGRTCRDLVDECQALQKDLA